MVSIEFEDILDTGYSGFGVFPVYEYLDSQVIRDGNSADHGYPGSGISDNWAS